ncbi:hypothetical protein MYCTH_2077534 [Thermothelomyces thermophilus ATCC 42464]|uniref:magnesium chelatase n=1 Tax=Thermothelomyces thermophilus (strain ATCC 42464 / BCRC 31852 / DSM 1799) TaxID=573729 RepID=G2Q899_THET4|nr:uncharacterized protein MYCTH_2077534 [Thermothelomyces thermophilus ATCC 42464]AEO56202.1 hypothetical protein MYCTH_2077534 [Thermothelomyces thermophilus ATCC 42464]
MADPQLLDKIHGLGDLELAVLLCLIAREHCLISTEFDSVDDLAEELRLVASKTFNLSSAIVSCHTHTTLEEFATGLFVQPARVPPSPGNTRSVSPYRPRNEASQLSTGGASSPGSYVPMNPSPRIGGHMTPLSPPAGGSSSSIAQARIANVVLAKDLDSAPRAVQIQALELLRTRRIFTRTSVQTAPKQFLFIALVGANSGGQARVNPHLNDFFYLSHWHDPAEDGFPYLDEEFSPKSGDQGDDPDEAASTISSSSVVKTPVFTEHEISHLSELSRTAHTSISVTRYQANLVAFLRTHRAVAPGSGVTPAATRHLAQLARSLAPLHGLDYVTPSLVALALRKVYLHRLNLVMAAGRPERERSVQWGSDVPTVRGMLEGWTVEDVLEDVLESVQVST